MEKCTLYDFEKDIPRRDIAVFRIFHTGVFSESLLPAMKGFCRIYNKDIPKLDLYLREKAVVWCGFRLYDPHNSDTRIFRHIIVRPTGEICFVVAGCAPSDAECNSIKGVFIKNMEKLLDFLQRANDDGETDPEFVIDWHGGGINREKFSFKLNAIEKIIAIAKGECEDETSPNNPIVAERNDVMQRKAEDLLHRFSEETETLHLANELKPSRFFLDETYDTVMNTLKRNGHKLYYEIEDFMNMVERTNCFVETLDEIKREFSSRAFIRGNL